jgi:hypothetical protein
MTATNTITGGGFQDSGGNALSGGALILQLSHDAYADDTYETIICGVGNDNQDFFVSYILDENGNVPSGSQAWPNDLILDVWTLLPDTYYIASAYTAAGQLAWGPNAVYILSSPSPYNIGTEWNLTNPA